MSEPEWGDFFVRVSEVGGARILEWASPPPDRGRIAREMLTGDVALFYDKASERILLLGIWYEVIDVGESDWVGAVRIQDR
jgi:hypothetical protein